MMHPELTIWDSAQRLAASEVRAESNQRSRVSANPCSTPCGIRGSSGRGTSERARGVVPVLNALRHQRFERGAPQSPQMDIALSRFYTHPGLNHHPFTSIPRTSVFTHPSNPYPPFILPKFKHHHHPETTSQSKPHQSFTASQQTTPGHNPRCLHQITRWDSSGKGQEPGRL